MIRAIAMCAVIVRIVGIDTPELARRGKPAQPGAVEATDDRCGVFRRDQSSCR